MVATQKSIAMASTADDGPPARDPDYYRKGGVRLLGYANECGEAFRPLVPQAAVSATYAVAFTYVAADASWRARTLPSSSRLGALAEAADTLVWQTLASVAIPGFTINRIVWASQRITTPPSVWAPTVCGLAAIPLIVDPIDHGVDVFMERVYRPLLRPNRTRTKAA